MELVEDPRETLLEKLGEAVAVWLPEVLVEELTDPEAVKLPDEVEILLEELTVTDTEGVAVGLTEELLVRVPVELSEVLTVEDIEGVPEGLTEELLVADGLSEGLIVTVTEGLLDGLTE